MAREKRMAELDAKEAEEEKEAEAKRMALLTQWAKGVFQKGRDDSLPDEEIVKAVKKTALEKNYPESQINQVLQDNGVGLRRPGAKRRRSRSARIKRETMNNKICKGCLDKDVDHYPLHCWMTG